MALIRKCPICGCSNPPRAQVCARCQHNLSGLLPQEEEPEAPPVPPAAEEAASEPTEGSVLVLEFPFGSRRFSGNVLLGRDNPDFGARIADDPGGGFVSGRHAVVSCRDGAFYVRHVGREDRNLTYIDDRPITAEERLQHGQTLSLSKRYHVQVRIEAE